MVAKFFHFTKLVMEERLQLGCSSEEDRGYNVDQSSNKKRKEEEKTIRDDLISYLPESLILAIMSFLSMEDTTRFGFASKKFFSVCKSIPVLDFNYFSFKKNSNISDPTQMSSFFLDFVAKSLELRNTSGNNDTCFQRLSFVGPVTDDLFSKMVDFSLDKKIKELYINGDLEKRNPLCVLPNSIFSAQHFTGLKIKGFHLNLEDQNFVLSCPLIENINLSRCSGFKTITLFGDKLKHVALDSCIELVKINIDPQVSVESFSYSALFKQLRKRSCELVFDLDSFKLLKFLEFKCIDIITDEWFQDHVSHMNLLESLKLDTCLMLKNIRMDSDNLKILVLRRCKGLEHIEIIAPNLESFQFEIMEEKKNCKVTNISSSKYLKSLKLRGATHVTDEWIEDNLSRFHFLEHLELKECNSLKKIEFCGGKLRSLKLLMCMSLSVLEIDAPNLVSFVYNGDLLSSPPVLNSNSRLHATLLLGNTPSYITESYRRYFRDFIGSFDHCKTLFLADISTQVLIYPDDIRDIMIPPLHDLKHLKVQAKWYRTQCIVHLVEGLLWLVPNPETISIILHDQDLEVVKSLNLKFHCKPEVKEEDVSCCASSPLKCWRHFLVEVEMDNFVDSYERRNLQEFLMNSAKGLTHVICTR